MQAVGQVKSVTMWEDAYPSNPVMILLSGKAGVGKTYCAERLRELLQESNYTSARVSFASGVKSSAYECFGWDGNKDEKGRKLLQSIGNTGRAYDPDIWVKTIVNSIEDTLYLYDIYIADDWRFENERDFLEEQSGFFVVAVRIESTIRGGLQGELAKDVSENSLPDDLQYYDFIIDNSDDGLDDKLRTIVNYIDKMEVKDV